MVVTATVHTAASDLKMPSSTFVSTTLPWPDIPSESSTDFFQREVVLALNSHFHVHEHVDVHVDDAHFEDQYHNSIAPTSTSPSTQFQGAPTTQSEPRVDIPFPAFSAATAAATRRFHASIPNYVETPLLRLDALAAELKIKKVWVKDESKRFGLNAFKVLGSSFAFAKEAGLRIAERKAKEEEMDERVEENDDIVKRRLKNGQITATDSLGREDVLWDRMKSEMRSSTFITATDGNHGYGVAWIAQQIPAKCHVLMPAGSATARVERTRALGTIVTVTAVGYDETVEMAAKMATDNNWLLVQDTSYENYEDIPLDIMQGYTTILSEALEELEEMPTHVFLQAGVGSFAGSLVANLRNVEASSSTASSSSSSSPSSSSLSLSPSSLSSSFVTIVEADGAECLFKSAERRDGKAEIMTTPCDTIMAGLNCSSPCTIAWPILRDAANAFLRCDDGVAACGMKLAYRPMRGDPRFISGESGAVTLGALYKICTEENLSEIKEQLFLNENSTVLLISTEGDTDPEGFDKIVRKER